MIISTLILFALFLFKHISSSAFVAREQLPIISLTKRGTSESDNKSHDNPSPKTPSPSPSISTSAGTGTGAPIMHCALNEQCSLSIEPDHGFNTIWSKSSESLKSRLSSKTKNIRNTKTSKPKLSQTLNAIRKRRQRKELREKGGKPYQDYLAARKRVREEKKMKIMTKSE